MRASRIVGGLLILTAGILLEGQQYTISTYAGGRPLPPSGAVSMAADVSGNLYFVDPIGNTVFKLDPTGAITRIAGTSRTDFSGDGGPAVNAALNSPRGVAVDPAGSVYILDAGNQRVRRVTPDGIISTYAGGGSAVLGDGGPAGSGQLNYPNSIAADSAGNIFIGEDGRVRKVSPDGTVTTMAGGGATDAADGVTATSARLTYVPSIAADGAGNLYFGNEILNGTADTYTYSVFKLSPGGILSTVPPIPGSSAVPGNAGIYSYPNHAQIAADPAGNLFLPANALLWKVTPGGSETVIAGTGAFGIGGDGGPATKAQMNSPIALAADTAGNLYIADSGGRAIRKISADGIIRSVATLGNFGGIIPTPPAGDGGPATSAQLEFLMPGRGLVGSEGGMATDSAGNLYFAESAAGRIRKVATDGTISTVAGVGGSPCPVFPNCLPLGDGGPATSASLSYPLGVAVDRNGNVFIADSANALVRKVTPYGMIATVAGNGKWPGFGAAADGPAANVPIGPVYDVTVDDAGDLFIAAAYDVLKVSTDGTISALHSGFGSVSSLALDRAGNLFVSGSQCDNNPIEELENCWALIQKFNPNGGVIPIAGCSTCTTYKEGGLAVNSPVGASAMVVTATGDLLITDAYRTVVRRIDANGIITTIAGNGAHGYSGDSGPALGATLNYATGLAADGAGNIYVSDPANEAVRVLRPAGH
jgi:sugar lactone lactonase YvrE